ncbi:MAG: hypothetical protein KF767_16890 [Bdellovibrionaceae bacterium]|nr:hypothetical protein [Pseudobdellovibrionaceae bacterium]
MTQFFGVIFRVISVGFIALSLTACAFDQSDTDPNRKRDLNNREKLVRAYESIQGVYEGTFDTPARIENVRLTISYTEVAVGKTQDGEIRYQPELRARFARLDRDIVDTYFTATMITETSDLTLTTQQGGGESMYIRGIVQDGIFRAPVKNGEGSQIGMLNVRLVSKEVIAPPEGRGNETYDRIKAILLPIQGSYKAVVKRMDGKKDASFTVDMQMRIEDTSVNGQILPVLVCYNRREDGLSLAARHTVIYNGDRTPIELTFTPPPNGAGYTGWSMKATFENNMIKGDIVYPTFVAPLEARKVPAPDGKSAPAPATPPKNGRR